MFYAAREERRGGFPIGNHGRDSPSEGKNVMKASEIKFRYIIPLWDDPPKDPSWGPMMGYLIPESLEGMNSEFLMTEALLLNRIQHEAKQENGEIDLNRCEFDDPDYDDEMDGFDVSENEKNTAWLLFDLFGGGLYRLDGGDLAKRSEKQFYEAYFSGPAITRETASPHHMYDLPY